MFAFAALLSVQPFRICFSGWSAGSECPTQFGFCLDYLEFVRSCVIECHQKVKKKRKVTAPCPQSAPTYVSQKVKYLGAVP